jgi:Xaa-Pro aminopeptidase
MMELAAGYRGYTAQIGSPICLGEPPDQVRRFFDDVVLPGFERMVETIGPDRSLEDARAAGRFFREHGAQSRPIHLHGIDLVTSSPHVFTDRIESEAADDVLQPGMVLVVEPTPITADGSLGMFFGHTFAVTETGRECLDTFPWQLTVV